MVYLGPIRFLISLRPPGELSTVGFSSYFVVAGGTTPPCVSSLLARVLRSRICECSSSRNFQSFPFDGRSRVRFSRSILLFPVPLPPLRILSRPPFSLRPVATADGWAVDPDVCTLRLSPFFCGLEIALIFPPRLYGCLTDSWQPADGCCQ